MEHYRKLHDSRAFNIVICISSKYCILHSMNAIYWWWHVVFLTFLQMGIQFKQSLQDKKHFESVIWIENLFTSNFCILPFFFSLNLKKWIENTSVVRWSHRYNWTDFGVFSCFLLLHSPNLAAAERFDRGTILKLGKIKEWWDSKLKLVTGRQVSAAAGCTLYSFFASSSSFYFNFRFIDIVNYGIMHYGSINVQKRLFHLKIFLLKLILLGRFD